MYGLKPDVFLPLADGGHLFLVGELSKSESYTPSDPRRAQSELFRYFRLHDWYAVVPFEEWRDIDGEESPRNFPRTDLRITDFDIRVTRNLFFDPHYYQKTQDEHQQYAARFLKKSPSSLGDIQKVRGKP